MATLTFGSWLKGSHELILPVRKVTFELYYALSEKYLKNWNPAPSPLHALDCAPLKPETHAASTLLPWTYREWPAILLLLNSSNLTYL